MSCKRYWKRSINAQVLVYIETALGQQSEIERLQEAISEHEDRIKELERDVSRLLDAGGLMYDRR